MTSVATAASARRSALDVEIVSVEPIVLDLPANDISGLRRLMDNTHIPVALDESLRSSSDLAQRPDRNRRWSERQHPPVRPLRRRHACRP
jgi:L-alanine-DL-glutamate epimerase-like enolase superfamily enzyme